MRVPRRGSTTGPALRLHRGGRRTAVHAEHGSLSTVVPTAQRARSLRGYPTAGAGCIAHRARALLCLVSSVRIVCRMLAWVRLRLHRLLARRMDGELELGCLNVAGQMAVVAAVLGGDVCVACGSGGGGRASGRLLRVRCDPQGCGSLRALARVSDPLWTVSNTSRYYTSADGGSLTIHRVARSATLTCRAAIAIAVTIFTPASAHPATAVASVAVAPVRIALVVLGPVVRPLRHEQRV